jgi:hypothetical protein
MISHALTIVMNELNRHLHDTYQSQLPQVDLGNLAEGFVAGAGSNGLQRNLLYLSMVNIKEEKALKNLPNRFPNESTLKVTYENPPVFINFLILLAATHTDYSNALLVLSRAIRFFQFNNVLTPENVAPESITTSAVPIQPLDQLESFKFIFDLYSPTLEESNHLWGTLGGKQYPFVLYIMRLLDLKFKAADREGGLITEVVSNFSHKTG